MLTAVAGAAVFAWYLASGGPQLNGDRALGGIAVGTGLGWLLHLPLHELAHAVTCKRFGREVHRAGIGWYLFLPVTFVDTSDIWLAPRRARVAASLAGPYTNFLLSGIASLLLLSAADAGVRAALFHFGVFGYVLGLANLNPLIELDGYYVLMDLLGIPNLRAKALAFLGALLWRGRATTREPRLARLYAAYGALAVIYTGVVALSVLGVYSAYVRRIVSLALPDQAAAHLGWVIAALMSGMVLSTAWRSLRRGALRQPRVGSAAT